MINNQETIKKFDWKSFTSFGLLFTFIIIGLTGLVLYITPPGRVAKWVVWTFLGLEKAEWQAIHTVFSYLFLLLGIIHTFFLNWKIMLSYFRKKGMQGLNRKKELLLSSLLVLVFLLGTLFKIPPFQTVMDFGEYLTESWEKQEQQAPMPHTEAMSLVALSKKLVKASPEEIRQKLLNRKLNVAHVDLTLADIGQENGLSPYEIYRMIAADHARRTQDPTEQLSAGSGIGRKTVGEIAAILNRDAVDLLTRLKDQGIDATENERLKDIAEKAGKTPLEVLNILKKK